METKRRAGHNLFHFTAAERCAGCRPGAHAQARIPRGVLSRHQSGQLSAPHLRDRRDPARIRVLPFRGLRAKSGLILHAFVIMGNHGHLALATRTNDPRLPVPFLIQNQPTPPASRPLRPTDSSRIPQSRFSGLGLITEQRIFSTRSADRSNHTRTGRLHSFL